MTQTEIITKLQPIFDQIFLTPPVLTPELTAKEVPEWDSLLHISLLIAVESAFGVHFRMGEVEATHNVGEFADLIGKHLASQ